MNNSTSIKHNPKGNGCPLAFKSLLLFIALALVGGGAWGQTSAGSVNMSNAPVSIETGTYITYYDNGGPSASYGASRNFTQTITADNGQPLVITFNTFALQNNSNNDYLIIYDGPNTLATVIGTYYRNTGPGSIITSENTVTFRFMSNAQTNQDGAGWAATITSMDISDPDITTCSGTFTDKQGGANYSRNQYYKQTYRSAEAGKSIRLDFSAFALQNNSFDRLILLDGDSLNAPAIGTYFRNDNPGTVISTNETLTAVFIANDAGTKTAGWNADISCFAITTFYSYQNGAWNNAANWTTDPSGSTYTNPDNRTPGEFDKAVILNGSTITVTNNGNAVTQLDIREGGILNVEGTSGHNFGTIMGRGRLRSSTQTLPTGIYTLFTQSGGGTIELYANITGAPTLSETTFNNLEINANFNQTVVIGNTTQINGNLLVSGGTLNINSAAGTSITVEGNINVNSGATFGLGNANNNNRALFVKGDFENEGTVTFTNRTTAGYTTNPGRSVDLVFNNPTQNQAFTCNGPTTLNRLIVDKGTDDTYMLDVNASATANFRLFGRNNADYNFPAEPPDLLNQKALEIYAGTLRLGSNISIPRLLTTPNTNSQFAFVIDQDAALILDGSTVNVSTQTDNSTIIVYGKLKVMGNSTFTSLGRQGIILREYGVVEVEGNPTINTTAFRTSSRTVDGAHRGTLTMSGGTLTITGNNLATSHPAFALPFPDNTLQLSGGIINVEHPSFFGATNTNESWLVSSNAENISITGGTVNIYANGTNARINSTAPFYNLNLISNSGNTISIEPVTEEQQDETVTVPAAPRRPLVVLNNLTVNSNTTFNPQSMDVTVGRNYTLNGAYTPGSNTTFFNAFGIQTFDNAGTINDGGLYNLTLNNSSNLILTNSLNVRSNLTINPQTTLRDGGNTINVAGNIINSGTHQSATGGSLILNGDGAQTIDGNGLGEFGNLSLNKATGSTTTNADFKINGNLRLGGTAAVLSIGSNRLELSETSYIYNALTGTASARTDFNSSRMVETAGAQSDFGVVKQWGAVGGFTYPIGANGKYTPAIIQVDVTPSAWGKLSVNPVNNIHPLATNPNSLKYYWNIRRDDMLGIPSGSLRLNFYFDDTDVVGNEELYIPAFYFPVSWTFFNDVNLVTNLTNEIRFLDVPDPRGHFTAGEPDAFGEVTTYFSSVTEGSWDELGSWSHNAAGTEPVSQLPGENSPVIIQSGHTINIPTYNKLVGSLTIEENGVLDIGVTTGHFFGLVHESTVSGTGTLRISSDQPTAEFPGGDFGDFLGDGGGTVEYYTIGTQDYIMPSGDITTITLLNEGFEGGFPPAGWITREGPNDAPGLFDPNTNWERSTAQANSGNASTRHTQLSYNFFGTRWSEQDDILVTPPQNFSDAATYQLTFWRYNNNPANYRYQGVWVSTTNNQYASFVPVQELGQGTASWVQHTIDLTQFAGEETVYIAFAYRSWGNQNSDDVYIDDVTITKSIGNSRYHNLVVNPNAGRTITLPGVDIATTGNVTVKGNGTAATSSTLSAMLSVGGDLNIAENSTLRIDNSSNFTLEQNGAATIGENASVTVNTAGATAREHLLTFYGNVNNNGTLNLNPGSGKYANLYFKGTTNQEFSGTGTTNLNLVYVDKGSSQAPRVNVTANEFAMNTGLGQALFIQNGTIRFSGTSLNLTLTTNSPFSIPATGCLSVNGSTVTLGSAANNNADLLLVGKLEVMGGTMNIGAAGNNTHNDIEYATAGAPEVAVSGGSLNVNGQIRRSTTIQTGNLTYRQSGGNVYIYGKNRDANQIKRALLEVLNDGRFISTGGNLHLVQGVGSGESSNTFGELYLNPASSTVTGGTIHTGTSQTNAANNLFNLYLGCPIYNLTIDGGTTAKDALLRTFPATLKGSLTIEGPELSRFLANGLDLNIAGDFISRSGNRFGSYVRGNDNQRTTFNGLNQVVFKDDALTTPGGGLSLGTVIIDQQNGGELVLENYEFWARGDLHLLNGSIIQNNASHFLVIKDLYIENGFTHVSTSNGRLSFYNASISQNIYTDGTGSLGRVVIFYNNGVNLHGDLTINNRLDFPSSAGASGRLFIGDHQLTFGPSASIGTGVFAPGPGRFIVTNGVLSDAGVTKVFASSGGSFTYPIGVGSAGGKYTPVTMNVSNTGGSAGSITVKPIDAPHPMCTNEQGDELQYFWNVTSTGFNNPTVSHQYQFVESDIIGDENLYVDARLFGYEWISHTGTFDPLAHTISHSNVSFIDGEYTAGLVENFGEIRRYYSYNGGGNWGQRNSWELDSPGSGITPANPPLGHPVFILDGHTITTNQDGAYAGSVDIQVGARLNLGNSIGHNLGHVTGGGIMALTATGGGSFVFPGGDYSVFMNTEGSTVEYSGAGTLPAGITTYQNVTFLGNNTRSIPSVDILVRSNLRIENGTLSNTSFNRTIRVEGNWVDLVAGGFNPGTGTVIFQGINEQTLTASGGAAETFYNLQINKTAGNLTLNNAATVNRVLTLSSGIVNTTATNLLTVNYGVSGAVVGGSSSAYVNGPLRRFVNNSSSANFPVGKDGRFGNLHILGTTTSGSQYWTGEYFNTTPNDNTNLAAPLQLISNNEYWTLQGVNGASTNVRLRWDDQSAIIPAGALDRQKLRIAQYLPPWTKVGETVNDVNQNQGTVQTSTPVSFDGSSEVFTLAIEQTASAEITSGDVMECNNGSTFPVTFNVTGDAPLRIVLHINGGNDRFYTNLAEGNHTIQLTYSELHAIGGAGDYSIIIHRVYDSNDLQGIVLGTGVTLTALPTPNPIISGPTAVMTGSTTTYSVSHTAGNTYLWSVDGLGFIPDPNSHIINVEWGTNTGTATLTLTESTPEPNSCTTIVTYEVDVRDWPVIIGDFSVCANSTEVYESKEVAGHEYLWVVQGGTIQETAPYGYQITVVWSSQTAGRVTLTQGPSGDQVTIFEDVTINASPTAILAVDGSADVCDGDPITLQFNHTGGGIAPNYELHLNGSVYQPYEDESAPKPNPYITEPLIWNGTNAGKEYTFELRVTNTTTGCTSIWNNKTVTVWKTPETGPQYHIPNTHGM